MEKRENVIVYEQDLAKLRVIHTEDDKFDIEVAVIDGPSIGTVVDNELQAHAITMGLIEAYKEAYGEIQKKMADILQNISEEEEKHPRLPGFDGEEDTKQ
jgi:hypothetical protein